MESIRSKLQAAAPRNQELVQTLSETDYAKPTLEQQKRYIADVENEIKGCDQRIRILEDKRKQELKDHEKYRDSTMRRFAYKVSRKEAKFNEKASKEEREYFDALQQEHKEREVRRNLATTLEQAQRARQELESVFVRHEKAQQELDALYDSIFEGPTPGYPDEDAKETAAHDALDQYHNMRFRAEAEQQVLNILSDADKKMNQAGYHLADARGHSQMDMFGGGAMSDMMERNALHKAEIAVMEAKMAVDQARRMSSEVHPLPQINIAKGNLMTDVFFDNIFTDMDFHEKIKASQSEQQRAHQDLQAQIGAAKQRCDGINGQLGQLGQALETARVNLQKAREEVFQHIQ